MNENPKEQLDKDYDEFLLWCNDWSLCYDMVSNAVDNAKTPAQQKQLHEYMQLLIKRVKHLNRVFNRVTYTLDGQEGGFYTIYNYTYDMYRWYISRKFDGVITPSLITIPTDQLTPEERERLNSKRGTWS